MNKFHKGFTLIELVVVIAILGILAGIAIPRFLDAQASAKGAKIVADLRTIDSAAMIYQAKTGSLPTSIAAITTNNTAVSPAQYQLLASWPVPKTGTFIVAQLSGGDKTFKDITAAEYTLADGRGKYNGQTVEYYLGTASAATTGSGLNGFLSSSSSALYQRIKQYNSMTHNYKGVYADTQEAATYSSEVESALASIGKDPANTAWAFRYNPSTNTISLYVADKLDFNKERGTQVPVTIYTGTVSNSGVTSWSAPSNGTAGIIPGDNGYARLNV